MSEPTLIAEHYDVVSPFYRRLWGEHLHHGYYTTGRESRVEATEALLERVVQAAAVADGARVLDVGSGFGGTGRWLARRQACRTVGLTLSLVQARMAVEERGHGGVGPQPAFVVGDAARLPLRGRFDAILALEVLSHVADRPAFLRSAGRLLVPGGRLGIAAWLAASDLSPDARQRYLDPIEQGMLVRLPTAEEYEAGFAVAGLEPVSFEDASARVCQTWDLCLDIVSDPGLWATAWSHGAEVVAFLRAFRDMRRGFRSGAFRYGILAAEKPS